MSKGRKRRWLKWAIWTPCLLGVLGIGSLVIMEHRIESGIREEERLLLDLGIDVRENVPESDAAPDYAKLAQNLPDPDSKPEADVFLSELERIGKKPLYIRVSKSVSQLKAREQGEQMMAIAEVRHQIALKAAKEKDQATLDRVLIAELVYPAQRLAGWDEDAASVFEASGEIDEILPLEDPRQRERMREILGSEAMRRLVRAKIAGVGRAIRRANRERGIDLSHLPWWRKALENQTTFRRSADLAILRRLRSFAQLALMMQPLDGLALHGQNTIADALAKEGSLQSQSAADRIRAATTFPEPQAFLSLRLLAITLDLRESYQNNKPLVPTWSQRYCYDPEKGLPIEVKVHQKTVTLSSFSPGGTPWLAKFSL